MEQSRKTICCILCDSRTQTSEKDPATWSSLLPNGETLLERQLRIFSDCGVTDFVLCMDKPQPDLELRLKRLLPSACWVSITEQNKAADTLQKHFTTENARDSVLLLRDTVLFDKEYAKQLLENEDPYLALSKERDSSAISARIDFKIVREVALGLEGVNCFPIMGAYRLKATSFFHFAECESIEKAIWESLSDLQLMPYFAPLGFVQLIAERSEVNNAYGLVTLCDYASQKTVRCAGALAQLKNLLTELEIHNPLIVADKEGTNSPVRDVLTAYSIPYEFVELGEDKAQYETICFLKQEFLARNEIDGIVAVGKKAAIQTAQILRLFCCCNSDNLDGISGFKVQKRFPLAAIPLNESAAADSCNAGCQVSSEFRCVEHSHLMPDVMIIDTAIFEKEEAFSDDSEKEIEFLDDPEKENTAEISFHFEFTSAVKRLLKPFPVLKKEAKIIYKTLCYLWYKRRYLTGNQSVVFDSYLGREVNCNPKALYEAMRLSPEYMGFKYIWAVKSPKRFKALKKNPYTKVVRYGSKAHMIAIASSRFIVSNVRLPEYIHLWPEQIYIQTWHGKPIKRIGQDVNYKTAGGNGTKENSRIFSQDARKLTYLCSPAPVFTEHMISAYNLKALGMENKIRETGYPRNDYLFQFTLEDVIQTKLKYRIPLNKKVVLYAPTWRPTSYETGTGYVYHQKVDFKKLYQELGEEYVLLFRAHINEARSIDFSELSDFVHDMTKVHDVNDLLIISDLLISDYSGIIFDYANLRRPIVLYQYDRDEYVNDLTGVYFDLDELPGKVVKNPDELSAAIKEGIEKFVYDEKYRRFNETYNMLDGAECGIRTAKELIPPDTIKTPEQIKREENWIRIRNMRCFLTGFLRKTGLYRNQNDRVLLSYKNRHQGERCFLIGNGPSLTLEDLEAIRGEISFCCNGIYRIFDRTNWRPTYYFFTDNVFESQIPMIKESFQGTFFSNNLFSGVKKADSQIVYANTITRDDYYVHGNMIDYYVSSRATVMSFMIEMAMFMGFREIYLLGVDCSNGFVGKDAHFMSGYMSKDMEVIEQRRTRNVVKNGKRLSFSELGQYRIDRSMIAYEKLREYADHQGVKIYNATRGGYLEAFQRVDLDSITLKKP